ncbi:HNH endonuclease [Tateyamaria sp. SN6-1]|uniref:HNH endonuclease n=1 Tax=Tateyamaria sp. SN6-1 TaxID=3092148 RepID=UPI0039F4CB2E
MSDPASQDYWQDRDCLRVPQECVLAAARNLARAVDLHLANQPKKASQLIASTNVREVRAYIDSLWGSSRRFPERAHYLRWRKVNGLPTKKDKAKDRMPGRQVKRALIERDGYHCKYCQLPVIPGEVRTRIRTIYPEALPWGSTNASQHAAFQALWLQYEHVLPASFGGTSDLSNMVIACAGCNYGKGSFHLRELGLRDPRKRSPVKSNWRGLTQFAEGTFL